MDRKAFIEKTLQLGIGLPLLTHPLMHSGFWELPSKSRFQSPYSGKVLIVGAGAAGMTAGYLLKQRGVAFQIIEAAPVVGGRIRKAERFAEFPIDLGAEWIHTHPRVLAQILNEEMEESRFDTMEYNPQTIQNWKEGRLKSHHYLRYFYSEWKFRRSTWFDFFEQHILPEVADHLVLNCPITRITRHDQQVELTGANGETFKAEKALITVPIKIFQHRKLEFEPPLPPEKTSAIDQITMGDGIKVFVKFRERFYPDMLAFGKFFEALREENKFVYDAAFGKRATDHVMGLFAINEKAAEYTRLGSDQAIIEEFLNELDQIFDGRASRYYEKHIVQNWSAEPFIQGSYSTAFAGNQKQMVAQLQAPVNRQLYFAGEALSLAHQATVHGACETAHQAVEMMLQEG